MFATTAFAQPAERQYVFDPAYLLTDQQLVQLNSLAAEISEEYGCGVHIVTTDDSAVNYNNIQLYAEDLYLYNEEFGYGSEKNGVLLLLGTYDRCYWLLAYGDGANFAFTDYAKDLMADSFVGYFAADDWYGGFADYIDMCSYVLSQAAQGSPVDIYYDNTPYDMGAEAYGYAFFGGLMVAIFACTIFRFQMKTARPARNAASYVNRNNFAIIGRSQHFTHSTVTRTRIQSNNNTGGSYRGGTTVNSRGFSGRGGRF